MKITVIDYKICNLQSISNALNLLKIPFEISDNKNTIKKAEMILMPGVGSANEGMKNILKYDLDRILIQKSKQIPFLGICLGMQLMFTKSEEGNTDCLNLIKGEVKKFESNVKIPQIGWNKISTLKKTYLDISRCLENKHYYFVNSYYCIPKDTDLIYANADYGLEFCAVVNYKNLWGFQFHPEKSAQNGLNLLKKFYETYTSN